MCQAGLYTILYINIYTNISLGSLTGPTIISHIYRIHPTCNFFSTLFSLTLFIARLRVDPFEEYANQIYILHYINYNTTYLLTVCNRFFLGFLLCFCI